jgi:hypothetical protein
MVLVTAVAVSSEAILSPAPKGRFVAILLSSVLWTAASASLLLAATTKSTSLDKISH